jgi:hypothetical protein
MHFYCCLSSLGDGREVGLRRCAQCGGKGP